MKMFLFCVQTGFICATIKNFIILKLYSDRKSIWTNFTRVLLKVNGYAYFLAYPSASGNRLSLFQMQGDFLNCLEAESSSSPLTQSIKLNLSKLAIPSLLRRYTDYISDSQEYKCMYYVQGICNPVLLLMKISHFNIISEKKFFFP